MDINKNLYIARDKDSTLAIYQGKPIVNSFNVFTTDVDNNCGYLIDCIPSKMFPEITFENSPVLLKPIINNE